MSPWKSMLGSVLLLAGMVMPVASLAQNGLPQQQQGGINLLAPLGDKTNIAVTGGFGTLLAYFNDAATWLIYVAMGICVWWVLQGGFKIMISGFDSGQRQKGIDHIKWAIIGIVLLLFAGSILRMLNSMFFK